jgi:hypothetical protein
VRYGTDDLIEDLPPAPPDALAWFSPIRRNPNSRTE